MWRARFGVSLADDRARRVTYEQAVLDLETVRTDGAETDRRSDMDDWYAQMEATDRDRPVAAPLEGLVAPSVEEANRDEDAAAARLAALQEGRFELNDETVYEIVDWRAGGTD